MTPVPIPARVHSRYRRRPSKRLPPKFYFRQDGSPQPHFKAVVDAKHPDILFAFTPYKVFLRAPPGDDDETCIGRVTAWAAQYVQDVWVVWPAAEERYCFGFASKKDAVFCQLALG